MAHNYGKHFGNHPNNHQHFMNNKVVEDVKDEEIPSVENEEVVESVEEETTNVIEYVNGVVSGCERLNIRAEDSKESEVLEILDSGIEVKIDLSNDNSSADFYKVVTPNGVEGYCMKKFITIN